MKEQEYKSSIVKDPSINESLIGIGVATGLFLASLNIIAESDKLAESFGSLILIRLTVAVGSASGGVISSYMLNRLKTHLTRKGQ
ncbi:MAG: hypothetical protein MUO64_20865 [Anaerolineales bacterium]|nr:hypothetical protein [Anaerolineales bacterium]